MILTQGDGRLTNKIIRNFAAFMVSKKQLIPVSFTVDTSPLGFNFASFGDISEIYHNTNIINDNDIIDLCTQKKNINYNISLEHFYQNQFIMSHFTIWLNSHPIRSNIISKNKFSYNNNNLFIHIRLGDIINTQTVLPLSYYENTIKSITFDEGFIASDSPEHHYIKYLSSKYDLNIIKLNEFDTILFGSSCKHIIISYGTFSWIIGTLGFFSNIYYPDYPFSKKHLHPFFYCNPSWNCISF